MVWVGSAPVLNGSGRIYVGYYMSTQCEVIRDGVSRPMKKSLSPVKKSM